MVNEIRWTEDNFDEVQAWLPAGYVVAQYFDVLVVNPAPLSRRKYGMGGEVKSGEWLVDDRGRLRIRPDHVYRGYRVVGMG